MGLYILVGPTDTGTGSIPPPAQSDPGCYTVPVPDCSTGGGCSAVRIRRHTAGPAGVSAIADCADYLPAPRCPRHRIPLASYKALMGY